jgi:exonuclease SbcD
MKIVHTADWHLGIRLMNQDRLDEQAAFVAWFLGFLNDIHAEVLLISGDVFDTGTPSNAALKLYFSFLASAASIPSMRHMIITGGNHDAPSLLQASDELLENLNISVVGSHRSAAQDTVFVRDDKGDLKLVVSAVPFLRDRDVRYSLPDESPDQQRQRLIQGIIEVYAAHAEYIRQSDGYHKGVFSIAMGHLFAGGGIAGDSEVDIHVGNLAKVPADGFPELYDYVALGHLHRFQRIGDAERIFYSGSPLSYSFSEAGNVKKIIVIDTDAEKPCWQTYDVPIFRPLLRLSGEMSEIETALLRLAGEQHAFTPFVELLLTQVPDLSLLPEQDKYKILKVTLLHKESSAAHHEVEEVSIQHIGADELFYDYLEINQEEEKEEMMRDFKLLMERYQQSNGGEQA